MTTGIEMQTSCQDRWRSTHRRPDGFGCLMIFFQAPCRFFLATIAFFSCTISLGPQGPICAHFCQLGPSPARRCKSTHRRRSDRQRPGTERPHESSHQSPTVYFLNGNSNNSSTATIVFLVSSLLAVWESRTQVFIS